MANEIVEKEKTQGIVGQIKSILSEDNVKKRFNEVLGESASQYMASIVNTVSASADLKKCSAESILSAAFVAASFDLPIDPNLGFAAIIPYSRNVKDIHGNWKKVKVAQFQIMYKGFIQLAIRSGFYEKMNCTEVYEDELVSYNPITGECEFVTDFTKCTQRDEGDSKNIVGYYATFQLRNGFRKELYMKKSIVDKHAKRYSDSYRYDLSKNKQNSNWSIDFDAMAIKTAIKRLLTKWGILSVKMQQAIIEDQKTYDENGEGEYGDNQPEIIEATDPFNAIEDKGGENGTPEHDTDVVYTDLSVDEFAEFETQFAEEQMISK